MSRESRLAKNTIILSIGTFLPKLATFLTLPVLTAYLTKEQYGVYDLITILVSLLLPVTTLLIQAATFRFLIDHSNDRNYAKLYFSNSIAFILPISIVSLVILFFFLPIDDLATRVWVCIYLFFDAIVANTRQISRGLRRNLDYSISAAISAAIKVLLAIVLVKFLQWQLLGAVIALALSPVLSLVFLFLRLKLFQLIDFHVVNRKTIKEMLAYSWPMVPNNMSAWVMRASDRFVISGVIGLSANAVYAVANKIPNLLILAQSAFAMAWQENASIASDDKDVAKYYSKMFIVMMNFYSGCLGLIIACTPLLFSILIKGDYSEAYPQMPILFLATLFHCMASFLGGIYIAFKRTKNVGITTVVAALCNLTVNLGLINFIGLYAASISTLVSYALLLLYRMKNIKSFIDIKYDIRRFLFPLVIVLIESILCWINNDIVNVINVTFGFVTFLFLNKDIFRQLRGKKKGKKNEKKGEI